VADVLPMAALEQGDPVTALVLLEADHEPLHTAQLRVRRDVEARTGPVASERSPRSIGTRCYRITMRLTDADYEDLLTLRSGLRRFLRWSEQQAEETGLTPAQHQLLLAIRGHADARGPTIGEIADYLLLRHHSAVGLVDRADAAGLVARVRDSEDHRVVRLALTPAGHKRLEALSALHLEELQRLGQRLPNAWRGLLPHQPLHGLPGPV
jgi:DNA-binding MarR family transcriptional regulator